MYLTRTFSLSYLLIRNIYRKTMYRERHLFLQIWNRPNYENYHFHQSDNFGDYGHCIVHSEKCSRCRLLRYAYQYRKERESEREKKKTLRWNCKTVESGGAVKRESNRRNSWIFYTARLLRELSNSTWLTFNSRRSLACILLNWTGFTVDLPSSGIYLKIQMSLIVFFALNI